MTTKEYNPIINDTIRDLATLAKLHGALEWFWWALEYPNQDYDNAPDIKRNETLGCIGRLLVRELSRQYGIENPF